MLSNKGIIEHGLWCEHRRGTTTVWFVTWTYLIPLLKHPLEIPTCHDLWIIGDILTSKGWDFNEMKNLVPGYMVEHVNNTMENILLCNHSDKPWWIHTNYGNFTVIGA